MFAKAVFLTQEIHRLHRTLREQARSHKVLRAPVGATLFAMGPVVLSTFGKAFQTSTIWFLPWRLA